MPSEKLSQPMDESPRLSGDTLDERVRRLEHFFDTLDSADSLRSPEPGRGELSGPAALEVIQRLSAVANRLRLVMEEVEARVHVGESDSGDALTARLLVTQLKGALRDCRLITTDVGARLDTANDAIKEAHRLLERETARADDPTASPS